MHHPSARPKAAAWALSSRVRSLAAHGVAGSLALHADARTATEGQTLRTTLLRTVVTAAALALLAGGCSGGDDTAEIAGPAPTEATETPAAEGEGTAGDSAGASQGTPPCTDGETTYHDAQRTDGVTIQVPCGLSAEALALYLETPGDPARPPGAPADVPRQAVAPPDDEAPCMPDGPGTFPAERADGVTVEVPCDVSAVGLADYLTAPTEDTDGRVPDLDGDGYDYAENATDRPLRRNPNAGSTACDLYAEADTDSVDPLYWNNLLADMRGDIADWDLQERIGVAVDYTAKLLGFEDFDLTGDQFIADLKPAIEEYCAEEAEREQERFGPRN